MLPVFATVAVADNSIAFFHGKNFDRKGILLLLRENPDNLHRETACDIRFFFVPLVDVVVPYSKNHKRKEKTMVRGAKW